MKLINAYELKQAILKERDRIPRYTTERYDFRTDKEYKAGNYMRGGIRRALRCLEEASAVDAVPVVRCKDCIYYENKEGTGWCDLNSYIYTGGGEWNSFDEADYCSHGERKEDENTGKN